MGTIVRKVLECTYFVARHLQSHKKSSKYLQCSSIVCYITFNAKIYIYPSSTPSHQSADTQIISLRHSHARQHILLKSYSVHYSVCVCVHPSVLPSTLWISKNILTLLSRFLIITFRLTQLNVITDSTKILLKSGSTSVTFEYFYLTHSVCPWNFVIDISPTLHRPRGQMFYNLSSLVNYDEDQ